MLPNYRNAQYRLGWTKADLDHGGSDRFVDAIVAWGDEEAIAARVAAQHAVGANHVCIQVLPPVPTDVPVDTWRRLAPALGVG